MPNRPYFHTGKLTATSSQTIWFMFAAILGGALVAGLSLNAEAVKVAADPWAAFASQHHCFLAVEDACSTETGTYIGTLRTSPLPADRLTFPLTARRGIWGGNCELELYYQIVDTSRPGSLCAEHIRRTGYGRIPGVG